MEEAKARAMSINALTGDQRGIPSPFVREYCYLQLRMLCELIALACLVAHGDIVASSSKELPKLYEPGKIFRRVSELHPDFYPVPCVPQRTADGWHLAEYEKPFLRREQLETLWNDCGAILHRGSLKKLVSSTTPFQNNFRDVNEWGQKILNLLSVHRILHREGSSGLIVFMQVDDLGGAVQVESFESLPAPFEAN